MENFLLAGRLNLEPIVTHQLPLSNFDDGFKKMQSGEAIKVVLHVPQEEKLPCLSIDSISVPAAFSHS
jgi:threonine 3-dehydrogenase